jgi:hypothetical protein
MFILQLFWTCLCTCTGCPSGMRNHKNFSALIVKFSPVSNTSHQLTRLKQYELSVCRVIHQFSHCDYKILSDLLLIFVEFCQWSSRVKCLIPFGCNLLGRWLLCTSAFRSCTRIPSSGSNLHLSLHKAIETQVDANEGRSIFFMSVIFASATNVTSQVHQNSLFF